MIKIIKSNERKEMTTLVTNTTTAVTLNNYYFYTWLYFTLNANLIVTLVNNANNYNTILQWLMLSWVIANPTDDKNSCLNILTLLRSILITNISKCYSFNFKLPIALVTV